MQFYVIHKDPRKNAAFLPDYALKRVNVREGYQILSDIGHYFGVHWGTQNKQYNYNHPAVMRWCKDGESFDRFVDYYEACLDAYEKRYNKKTAFHIGFRDFLQGSLNAYSPYKSIMFLIEPRISWEQLTISYLMSAKRDKLTEEETKILGELYLQKGGL